MFHILVVDDDKNTRILMRAVLEAEHYEVTTAADAQKALDAMDHNHIDLIILDIMMPGMDGYELTELLRETNSDIPILMVSAKQLPADRKKGFLVGTDDYMTKPVDEEEMLLRIRALLRRAKIVSERKIVIGDVVLDYDSFTVTRTVRKPIGANASENGVDAGGDVIPEADGGDVLSQSVGNLTEKDTTDRKVPSMTTVTERVKLPQKEFLLLYKLLSYPDKIFTRIQLMDEIWGADSETGWETVTVHIGRLRRRFEGWKEFSIESVRGLGYKAVKHV